MFLTRPAVRLGIRNGIRVPFRFIPRKWPQNHLSTPQFQFPTRHFTDAPAVDSEREEVEEMGRDTARSGRITIDEGQMLFYFDNVFPVQGGVLMAWHWIVRNLFGQTSDKVLRQINTELIPEDLREKVVAKSIVPVYRDGGAFAVLTVPSDRSPTAFKRTMQSAVNQQNRRPWFNPAASISCYAVKGVPWVEDLRRYPSSKIKVVFEGPDLTEEELYLLFRRYGCLLDIVLPPPGTKDLPRHAFVSFDEFRAAACSRNCLNGLRFRDTTLHLQYEPIVRAHVVRDFLISHSRITIPLILALAAAFFVLIFDPIRTWFIEQHIRGNLNFADYKLFKTLREYTKRSFAGFHRFFQTSEITGSSFHRLWSDREDKIAELKLWLQENVNTFIVVMGPRGTGKHELVCKYVLQDRPNVLYLDCDKLVKARTDAQFISTLSHEVSYYPVFPWINSASQFLDLIVQGLTGQKAGMAVSPEEQLRSVLGNVMAAIRHISLAKRSQELSEGDSSATGKEEDYLQAHPESKPVVVIDRYRRKAEQNSFVYKELADWAALLISANLAHVIFITEDVGSPKLLNESLPNHVFKYVPLADASREAAYSYLRNQLQPEDSTRNAEEEKPAQLNSADFQAAIDLVGGRLLDLQAFVRRVKSGEPPKKAMTEMVIQGSEEILQKFLVRPSEHWTPGQTWVLIKALAKEECISVPMLMLDPNFKGAADTLDALEQEGLVRIQRENGLAKTVTAGKPLYRASFRALAEHPITYPAQELSMYDALIKKQTENIRKLEEEFSVLFRVSDKKEVRQRIDYLAGKIAASQNAINEYEKLIAKNKDMLKKATKE